MESGPFHSEAPQAHPPEEIERCSSCGIPLDVSVLKPLSNVQCINCGKTTEVLRDFDHFRLLKVLGEGGEGTVYQAFDSKLQRPVAVKFLRIDLSRNKTFIKKFAEEAAVTASINHPHVVRVFSSGTAHGLFYLAMELMERGTLRDAIKSRKKLGEFETLTLAIQIAEGLRAAAQHSLIHRDIKPGNIMITSQGNAKIVDFGLAASIKETENLSGEIWGTPYYLPPERLNGDPEDFRSDMYSLGATLFHTLAGRPPFEARDATLVALKHLQSQVVGLQTFAPHVSNATAFVINRMLHKNAGQRFQSYDELIEHLQYAQSALAQNGDQPTQGRTRIVLESDQEKKIWSWITAAMLLMAVTFTVYFFVFRKDAANNGIENAAAPGQSTAGGSERIFRDARRLFAHGNLREATLKFAQLKADKQTPEEIRSWILLHEALATLMENRQAEAKKMFADLATKTEPQSATPLPVLAALARQAAADEPVPAAAAAEIDKEGEEALALLVWGIKNMQENAVDSGVALLRQFRAAPLSPSVQWVSDYRRLAQPYLSDYTEYRAIADATKSVRLDEAAALISKAEEAKIRMTTPAIVKAVDEVIAPLVKSRELLESNLAYGRSAKTSSDLRPGESGAMALDGVSKSKWCSKDAPEHWLRVDLGAKRTIGRWVTKNAGYIGEDRSVNTRAFTLQSSDDSTNWRDIDAVTQNISDVTDRLVEPFEARYVRLLIFKPAQTNGEEKARLLELELYAPGIKTITYRADADVARSVMPGSSWISGDIGPIKIAGGAEWNSDSKSLTVQGSGDPWNAEDTAHLVSQPVTGNVELSARVVSEGDLPSWTKFGITLRRDRDARALHSSTFVVIKHGVMNIYRPDNGKMTHVISGENEIKAPVWLRVSRIGDHFLSAYSSDGQKWTALGEVVIPGLPPTMVAGLIVSSHEEQKLHSVTFEQIKVTALPANAKVGSELIAEPINGQAVEKRFIPIDMGAVLNANTRTGVYEEKAPKDLPLAITGAIRVGKVPFFIPDPAKGNNALALRGGMSPFSKALPKRVEIPLKKLRIQGLSFLGGVAAWGFPYGGDANANLPVVKVTVEFADGRQEELIFKNGVEYCDHVAPVVMPGAKIVEKLAEKDAFVHFFERKLSQPGEITKLVLESYDNVVVPAVLAITAEVAPVQIKP